MGKVTRRLGDASVIPKSGERIDRWFARAAQASQVLLLLLGIFGYFYTVLPVYQKSLLDEEIAKKTIELNHKTAELVEKFGQVNKLTALIDTRTRDLEEKDRKLNLATSGLYLARAEKDRATTKAEAAGYEARLNYAKLRREYYGAVFSHIRSCAGFRLFGLEWPTMDFEQCLAQVPGKVQVLFGQLDAGELPRLQTELGKLSTTYKNQYTEIVGPMNERIGSLNVELKPIQEAYSNMNNFPVNSKEWTEAAMGKSGRGRKLEQEIRAHQTEASAKYAKLLEKICDELWDAVQRSRKKQ